MRRDGPFPEGMVEEIARVISADTSPSRLDLYPCVFDSPLMFPLQRQAEAKKMVALARTISPRTVLEVGADKAGGCYGWIKGLSPERFVGIEVRGVPYASLFEATFPQTRQLWLGESSYDPETVTQVYDWLDGEPIDVLFIDGDKAQFLRDLNLYLPAIRRGGIIFMHDVSDAAPGEAFRWAQSNPRVFHFETIRDVSEVQSALDREAAGIPPATAHEGWLRHWQGKSCTVGVLWV